MKIKESKLREIIREALYREAGKRVVAEGRIDELFGLFGGGKKKGKPNQGETGAKFPEKISRMFSYAVPSFTRLRKGMEKRGLKKVAEVYKHMIHHFGSGLQQDSENEKLYFVPLPKGLAQQAYLEVRQRIRDNPKERGNTDSEDFFYEIYKDREGLVAYEVLEELFSSSLAMDD